MRFAPTSIPLRDTFNTVQVQLFATRKSPDMPLRTIIPARGGKNAAGRDVSRENAFRSGQNLGADFASFKKKLNRERERESKGGRGRKKSTQLHIYRTLSVAGARFAGDAHRNALPPRRPPRARIPRRSSFFRWRSTRRNSGRVNERKQATNPRFIRGASGARNSPARSAAQSFNARNISPC